MAAICSHKFCIENYGHMLLRSLNSTSLIFVPKSMLMKVYYDFPKGPNYVPPFHSSPPLPSISTIFAYPPFLSFPSASLGLCPQFTGHWRHYRRILKKKFNMQSWCIMVTTDEPAAPGFQVFTFENEHHINDAYITEYFFASAEWITV